MQFLQPWMLLGLLAAAVPIILHLMNRQRAQRIRFPMLTMVSLSQEERRASLKLKRWLLLAARIGILLLIPLAMAQPYSECGASSAAQQDRYPAAVVVIVDVSASMSRVQKHDVQEEAIKQARRTIRGLKAWDQVRVLRAGLENQWLNNRWHSDHQAALAALDKLSWETGTTSLPSAIEEAQRQLLDAQLPLKKIVIITDNDADAWTSDAAKPDNLHGVHEVRVVPIEVDNKAPEVFVSELTWEQNAQSDQDSVELRARIDATGLGALRADVHLTIDGALQSSETIDLEGGSHAYVSFTHTFKDDDVHVVRVDVDGPGVRANQERWMHVHLSRSVRALLVNGARSSVERNDELYYLSRALSVEIGERQSIHYTTVTPENFDAAKLQDVDVVVLANVESLYEPSRQALQQFVKDGGGLWIAAGSHVRAEQYNRSFGELLPQRLRDVTQLSDADDPDANIRATRFARIDYRSPLFQSFSMPGGQSIQSARVFSYLLLEPDATSKAQVLASYADGGPAVVESAYGRGRVVLWTTSLDADWTDLPIRTAYVPLVHRTLQYLAQRGAGDAQSTVVGDRVTFDLSGLNAERLDFETQDGVRLSVDVEDGIARLRPEHPGVYHATLVTEGNDERAPSYDFSINAPASEATYAAVDASLVSAWEKAAATSAEGLGLDDQSAQRHRIWPSLLLVALFLLYLESLLGVRRRVWDGFRARFGRDQSAGPA